jgi:hypothetical protein
MSEIQLRETLEELDENGYRDILSVRAYQRFLLEELGHTSYTDLDVFAQQKEEVQPDETGFRVIDDQDWMVDQVERASERMLEHWQEYRQNMRKVEQHWGDYLDDWDRYQDGEIGLEHFQRYGESPEDFGDDPEVRHQTTVRIYNSVMREMESLERNLADVADEPYAGPLEQLAETV